MVTPESVTLVQTPSELPSKVVSFPTETDVAQMTDLSFKFICHVQVSETEMFLVSSIVFLVTL